MPEKYILIVDDEPLQRIGVRTMVKDLGDYKLDSCEDVREALKLLEERARSGEPMYSLVMCDLQLPLQKGLKADTWGGANLLYRIHTEFGHDIKLVLYSTKGNLPNIGDMQQLDQAGASALYVPPNAKEDEFRDALRVVMNGHRFVHRIFKPMGILAADPANRCPLDPVEYYCARLIAENNGKRGAAEVWSAECDQEVTVNMVDDLLEGIYSVMSMEFEEFSSLKGEQKAQRLSTWYHNKAVAAYGAALPVKHESRKRREKKYHFT